MKLAIIIELELKGCDMHYSWKRLIRLNFLSKRFYVVLGILCHINYDTSLLIEVKLLLPLARRGTNSTSSCPLAVRKQTFVWARWPYVLHVSPLGANGLHV